MFTRLWKPIAFLFKVLMKSLAMLAGITTEREGTSCARYGKPSPPPPQPTLPTPTRTSTSLEFQTSHVPRSPRLSLLLTGREGSYRNKIGALELDFVFVLQSKAPYISKKLLINLLNAEVHMRHKSDGLVVTGSLLQGCMCQTPLVE